MKPPRFSKNGQIAVSILAFVVGAVTAVAIIIFRESIAMIQNVAYGTSSERLFAHIESIPWWQVVLAPTLGGLLIGIAIKYLLPDERPQGLADVIESSALRGGHMLGRVGFKAAVINAASIGFGASVGREAPAVHFGAALASSMSKYLHLTQSVSRTLLGCGAAAAVAASFNAPIAGALFASEVVIGHYALSAFAPIVIASVTGTVISRYYFGDYPAFAIPEHIIESMWEFPAFVVLGVIAGLTAMVFMQAIMTANDGAQKMPIPGWMRPAVGGLIVGIMALWFPQVLGVGYGVTEAAVMTAIPLSMLLAVFVAKICATAISIGFGFGGGVFSPSLVIGAMLGGAYGTIFTQMFPDMSTGTGAYTILGMGAVAAAVLGAPISTALIVFEMTSDYALTLALMVCVVISSMITKQFHGGSFFTWQLERRGHDLRDGYEMALLKKISVSSVLSDAIETIGLGVDLPEIRNRLQTSKVGELFVVDNEGRLFGTITLADMSEFAFDPELDHLVAACDVARR
ncbi:MAG: chloride channel protein, partial [Rhodospirillaceae bacterium]|nr:chloride channel protein [Rhodospirillaceae bacterium]